MTRPRRRTSHEWTDMVATMTAVYEHPARSRGLQLIRAVCEGLEVGFDAPGVMTRTVERLRSVN